MTTETEMATRRQRNEEVVRSLLAAVNAVTGDTQHPVLADDISYEAPYYGLDVRGREQLIGMFNGLSSRFDPIDYQLTEIFPALDPDLVIFEVRGNHQVKDSTKRYQNHYIMFVYFGADGKIQRWVEFSNPKVYEAALA